MKIYHIFHGNKYVSGFTSRAKALSVMNELIKLYPETKYMLYECVLVASTP